MYLQKHTNNNISLLFAETSVTVLYMVSCVSLCAVRVRLLTVPDKLPAHLLFTMNLDPDTLMQFNSIFDKIYQLKV